MKPWRDIEHIDEREGARKGRYVRSYTDAAGGDREIQVVTPPSGLATTEGVKDWLAGESA